jgi:hypothetical protein
MTQNNDEEKWQQKWQKNGPIKWALKMCHFFNIFCGHLFCHFFHHSCFLCGIICCSLRIPNAMYVCNTYILVGIPRREQIPPKKHEQKQRSEHK